MLEDAFDLPVFINNDGDMFAYGEARAGCLPTINRELAEQGNERRVETLIGLTLGTGLGCGVYTHGTLLRGDNDAAAEIWSVTDHTRPGEPAEESVSIRGLKRSYAELAGVDAHDVPEPHEIFDLLDSGIFEQREAASVAFKSYYMALSEVVLSCIALFDGIVVLGGGIAGSALRFLPLMEKTLNAEFPLSSGGGIRRLESTVYNLSDPARRAVFLQPSRARLEVPGSGRTVSYSTEKRSGILVAAGDTSETIMKGAYFYAIDRLRENAGC